MPNQYDRTTYGGKTVDWYTRAALEAAAAELDYADGLTIVQGSYNSGVGASAGTHDGGGAVDLAPFEADRKVRILRKYGFAAWRRLPSQGPWNEHVHCVQVGNAKLSPAAAAQVADYKAGRNGLASHAKDDGPREFVGTVFPWPPPVAEVKPQRVVGVDISHHQSRSLGLPLARSYGVKFVYHKATEGTTYRDPNYSTRRAEVQAFNDDLSLTGKLLGRGIRFGAYHFARPEGGDAADEARAFLKYAQPKAGDLAPVLDLEVDGGLTMGALDHWAARFIRTLHRAGIKTVGIYTPYDLPIAQEQASFVWRPRYNNSNTPPVLAWDVWQFSNGELGIPSTVPGFGSVDLNTTRKGFSVRDMRIKLAKTTEPQPEPPTDPEPQPEPKRVGNVRIGSANLGPRKQKIKASLTKGAAKFDIIGCQEAGAPEDWAAIGEWLAENPDWAVYKGEGLPGQNHVPVFYRPVVVQVEKAEGIPVNDGKSIRLAPEGAKKKGAGPAVRGPIWVTHLTCRHAATDRLFHVLDTHYPASWTRTKDYLGAGEWELRRKAGAAVTDVLVATIKRLRAPVFVTGDMNATPDFELLAPLDVAPVRNTRPTNGKRLIDQVRLSKGARGISVVGEDTAKPVGGDHLWPVVTFRVEEL